MQPSRCARHRLKVAQLVVDQGYPISEVAARFQVSWPTVKRWADRYAAGEPMADRSSRPRRQPGRTPPPVVRRVLELRWRKRLGPLQLAARTGVAASTVHKILVRNRINRLNYVDRATGEPVRRYEHDHPGSLIHVDVKKLGNIPDGGGWRSSAGPARRLEPAGHRRPRARTNTHQPLLGHAYVHTVIDDHTRVAYAEVHDDETALTATAVLARAVAWYSARGVTVERVLSDNGAAYRVRSVARPSAASSTSR
jgi:transposase-like protein